jgi:hypothetical protein
MLHGMNYEFRTRLNKITNHTAWNELIKLGREGIKSHTMVHGMNL